MAGIIAILIAESNNFGEGNSGGDPDFTIFKVFFEAVSAFGTVGLSLGASMFIPICFLHVLHLLTALGGYNQSFVVRFTTFSKFVLMFIMIIGRHRGIPLDIDSAVKLPQISEKRFSLDIPVTRSIEKEMSEGGKAKSEGVKTDEMSKVLVETSTTHEETTDISIEMKQVQKGTTTDDGI